VLAVPLPPPPVQDGTRSQASFNLRAQLRCSFPIKANYLKCLTAIIYIDKTGNMPVRCYGINMIKYIYMQKTNSSRDVVALVKMSA
jgi:hypothetical protein